MPVMFDVHSDLSGVWGQRASKASKIGEPRYAWTRAPRSGTSRLENRSLLQLAAHAGADQLLESKSLVGIASTQLVKAMHARMLDLTGNV
jgi:hypothetical protein